MNKNIKVLDCTLRDGGYVIDWDFGDNNIQDISKNLSKSHIDFIECGFLKQSGNFSKDKTFYSDITDFENRLLPDQKYTLMINYGEYDEKYLSKCINKNLKIRVAFKKHSRKDALRYIRTLKFKDWDIFANPMSTNTYSKEELLELIDEINEINPYGFSIVDTLGNMYGKDVVEVFNIIDKNLNAGIAMGFHSHNSMQLSFSNTKSLLKLETSRETIIDSSLYGMGRGAGNLCTELITKYLNDRYDKNYDVFSILKIIGKNIKPFYETRHWGYSTPYYIAAIRGCHPNYASFLINQNIAESEIDEILFKIPEDKKTVFDKNLIEEICYRLLI
ncbi:MAG: aldolase catalytic domain-containing protein [bacterium]|nr:aldolase catalytic domain-containing protein [bacterium]